MLYALGLGEDGLEADIDEEMTGENDCKETEDKDAWWCDFLYDLKDSEGEGRGSR